MKALDFSRPLEVITLSISKIDDLGCTDSVNQRFWIINTCFLLPSPLEMFDCLTLRMLVTLSESFWKAEYWLPPGYTWADLEDADGIIYPHPKDLLATIPLTFVLTIIRYVFERTIALPLGRAMGVRDPIRIKATPNPILESFFWNKNRNPKEDELNHLASQCGLTVRQTQCWFRYRRNQERPLVSKKFSEACWRLSFYSSTFFGGFFIFYNKTWFSEPETIWNGYPKQPLQLTIYWWYLMELSFYCSLLLTLIFDVKRSDFREHVIHHFLSITLLSFSYCSNFVRIGAMVLLLHDASDIFLESCKMFVYAQWKQIQYIAFALFALVFFVNRLILFPVKTIYTSFLVFQTKNQFFFGYYFSIALLILVQCLNIYWSSLIAKAFCKILADGQLKNDLRSDVEEEYMSDEKSAVKQQNKERLKSNDITGTRARKPTYH
ncbi:ceramide synthase 4-like [Gracilinanus agilis]|uniref:ceramide synthase 4-like n=1 Tax=Gracilinanus agilis TaxID=191870 RepID=UPI001CFE959E|nr:ceramide synthase 4-like [Gracilinanus agilis]